MFDERNLADALRSAAATIQVGDSLDVAVQRARTRHRRQRAAVVLGVAVLALLAVVAAVVVPRREEADAPFVEEGSEPPILLPPEDPFGLEPVVARATPVEVPNDVVGLFEDESFPVDERYLRYIERGPRVWLYSDDLNAAGATVALVLHEGAPWAVRNSDFTHSDTVTLCCALSYGGFDIHNDALGWAIGLESDGLLAVQARSSGALEDSDTERLIDEIDVDASGAPTNPSLHDGQLRPLVADVPVPLAFDFAEWVQVVLVLMADGREVLPLARPVQSLAGPGTVITYSNATGVGDVRLTPGQEEVGVQIQIAPSDPDTLAVLRWLAEDLHSMDVAGHHGWAGHLRGDVVGEAAIVLWEPKPGWFASIYAVGVPLQDVIALARRLRHADSSEFDGVVGRADAIRERWVKRMGNPES